MLTFILNILPGDAEVNAKGGGSASTYILAGGLSVLIVGWGVLRYWLWTGRKPKSNEIPTPTIDRLNIQALSKITEQNDLPLETVDEPAPDDLLAVVPANAHLQKAPATPAVASPNPYSNKK